MDFIESITSCMEFINSNPSGCDFRYFSNSFRFERGCDPNITLYALKRATLLIKEIAGGEISSEIVDIYPGEKWKDVCISDFRAGYTGQ